MFGRVRQSAAPRGQVCYPRLTGWLVWLQYENLDEQHKGLFKGVFAVAEARSDAGALSHLAQIVKSHFETEEVSQR